MKPLPKQKSNLPDVYRKFMITAEEEQEMVSNPNLTKQTKQSNKNASNDDHSKLMEKFVANDAQFNQSLKFGFPLVSRKTPSKY